ALELLASRNIRMRYVVVGDGAERGALKDMARKCGLEEMVEFRGHVSDREKWRVLGSADVFAMASRFKLMEQHEGFGIAFVEANIFGVPAIGTRTGGIPDAIVDGETGVLVEPESPVGLANALEELYRNAEMRHRMGASGRHRARRYSPERVARDLLRHIGMDGESQEEEAGTDETAHGSGNPGAMREGSAHSRVSTYGCETTPTR